MSKKIKETQRSVSTATPTPKREAIKPTGRIKMVYDTRTGFITRVSE